MKIASILSGILIIQFSAFQNGFCQSENNPISTGHRNGIKTIEKSAEIPGVPPQEAWQINLKKNCHLPPFQ